MGNSVNSSQKSTGSATNTGSPAWGQANQQLQTGPVQAANQTLAQGGQGATTQNVSNQLMNDLGTGEGLGYKYLTGTAQGDYLNGSPYLDSIISKGAQNVADQTNQMFAAGGRYGSAAHQGTLSDSVQDYAGQLRNANYQQERDRQLAAGNALEDIQMNRLNWQRDNRLAAAGLENQGFNNMLGMIGQLGNIQNNKVFDAQQQMGVGGQIDQRAQQGLTDLINQWSQTDMEPWARLGGLMSAGTTTAGNWGTQTQKSTQPANVAGIIGGLASLFSDRRLKEDIRRIGTADNGLPIYAYRYKGEVATHIGFMADEVEEIHPEAVSEAPNGFKMVNYDMAVI